MATKWYTKDASYTLPAWNILLVVLDGLYIDGELFYNDVPVLDNIVWISVQPDTWHIVTHNITFNVATFNKSTHKVDFLSKTFTWLSGQGHAQSDKIFTNGNPYGMGVNMFGVTANIIVGGPIANPIVYDVSFIMEVAV